MMDARLAGIHCMTGKVRSRGVSLKKSSAEKTFSRTNVIIVRYSQHRGRVVHV